LILWKLLTELRKQLPSTELTFVALARALNQNQEHHLHNAEVAVAQVFSKSDKVHSLFNKFVVTAMVQAKSSGTLACKQRLY
jgi:hypothetical protein